MYVFSCKNMLFNLLIFLLESESSEIYTHYVWKLGQSFFGIKMFKNKAKIAPEST